MKNKILTIILAVILLASAAAFAACNDGSAGEEYLVLVNKKNTVGADYVPNDLVYIDSAYTTGGKSIQMNRTALDAAIEMLDDMNKDGIKNVTITSAYRTYSYQKMLFDRYLGDERAEHPTWSEDQVKQEVLTYSAYPGTSEHQTGLCIDLFTTEMIDLVNYGDETPPEVSPYDLGFAETEAYEWLCENAYKYGFILRFPENKTNVTGYSYESWHYRYVGKKAAKEIHDRNITLEEYLE